MLADHFLVWRTVYAIELVVGDVAVDPLNLRPEFPEHVTRSLRGHLDIFGWQPAYARHLTLDHILGHVRFSTSLPRCSHTASAVLAIATENPRQSRAMRCLSSETSHWSL